MTKFTLSEPILEKVEKHETLNPKLWNEDHNLKPEVEEKINQIVAEFIEGLAEDEIKIEVKDVLIIGSNASYNYNDGSDLDLHIIAKTDTLDCPEKHLAKLYSAYRSIFNKKFDIDFYGINVELYVETDDTKTVSNGIYSVLNRQWIKEPVQADIPEVNNEEIQKEVGKWTEKYNDVVANRVINDIDDYIEQVYNLRKQSMEAGEEFGVPNLVFKEIRNAGYLDKLKELKAEIKSQELSLESLKEDLIAYETSDDLEKAFKAFKDCKDPKQKRELRKAVHIALFQTHDNKGIKQDRWEEIYNATHDKKWGSDLKEDTTKQGNAWVNRGKAGTHGKFKTKKAADAQRKAMYANGFKEDLMEDLEDAKSIVADQLRGEWEAIQNYNKAVKDLKEVDLSNFNEVINLLNDIASEEETHCGELQKALETIDTNLSDNIDKGKTEAEEKLAVAEEEQAKDEIPPVEEALLESSIIRQEIDLTDNETLSFGWDKDSGWYVAKYYQVKGEPGSRTAFKKKYPSEETAKHAFDKLAASYNKLTDESLTEANLNYSDQERKMIAWHNGYRGANIASMSDEKLEMNWGICKQLGYYSEANELEAEGQKRGLSWAKMPPNPITAGAPKATGGASQAVGIQNTASGQQSQVPQLTPRDFDANQGELVLLSVNNPQVLVENASTKAIIISLIWAVVLKQTSTVAVLKDHLTGVLGIPIGTLKQTITEATDDALIMRILEEGSAVLLNN